MSTQARTPTISSSQSATPPPGLLMGRKKKLAKVGQEEAADRYMLASREAALRAADHYLLDVGPGAASVQKRPLRQRVNCCVARAQAGIFECRLAGLDRAPDQLVDQRLELGPGQLQIYMFGATLIRRDVR